MATKESLKITRVSEVGPADTFGGLSPLTSTDKSIIPITVDVPPQVPAPVNYEFFAVKGPLEFYDNGEIDTSRMNNIFKHVDTEGNFHSGIFTVEAPASVSHVTLSNWQVIGEIIANLQKKPERDSFKQKLVKKQDFTGRDNVAPLYKDMYEKFITPLINLNDTTMTPAIIRSLFIGAPGIKAGLDSAPLGEIVLAAMDNNLCACFDDLSVTKQDVQEYLDIFTQSKSRLSNWAAERKDLFAFINFWVSLEYCRIFQLYSADILGAVNGSFILREIIDYTGFTGFISIPKGNGGEILVDANICVYALFLQNVLTDHSREIGQNFFLRPMPAKSDQPPASKRQRKQDVDPLQDTSEAEAVEDPINEQEFSDTYAKLLTKMRNILVENKDFIWREGITNNNNAIYDAVITLIKTLDDKVSKGVLHGNKTNNFISEYNTHKIITVFANFIADPEHNVFFKNAITKLNMYYDYTGIHPVQYRSKSWETWLCFQLSRYQQTQKVYITESLDTPMTEVGEQVDDIQQFLYVLVSRKNHYAEFIKNSRPIFQKQVYVATENICILESFVGHDNNSAELDIVASDVIEEQQRLNKNGSPLTILANILATAPTKLIELCIKTKPTFQQPKPKLHVPNKYTEQPLEVIKYILRQTKCTCFFESFSQSDHINIWTVGKNGPSMIFKRDDENGKLPTCLPTVKLLDVITGQKTQEQDKTLIVVDLAKYVSEAIGEQKADDSAEKLYEQNKLLAENMFLNQMITENVISINYSSTVVQTTITNADAASFIPPTSTIYLTKDYKTVYYVGSNIIMVTTFTAGKDKNQLGPLLRKNFDKLDPLDFDKELLATDDGKNLVICLRFLYTLKPNPIKGDLLQMCKTIGLTPSNCPASYASFLQGMFKNTLGPPENYTTYEKFFMYIISNISELNAKDVFTDGSKGTKAKLLINRLFAYNPRIAQAFIVTMKKMQFYIKDKSLLTIISKANDSIADFLKVANEVPVLCRLLVPTNSIDGQLGFGILANCRVMPDGLQLILIAEAVSEEQLKVEKQREAVLELATFYKPPTLYTDVQDFAQRASPAEFYTHIAELNNSIDDNNTQISMALYNDPTQQQLRISLISNFMSQRDFLIKKLLSHGLPYPQITSVSQPSSQLVTYTPGPDVSRLATYMGPALETITPADNGSQMNTDSDSDTQYFDALSQDPFPQSGGDEDINKIMENIQRLEAEIEANLRSQIKYTTGPISELEYTKTVAILGPKLYEKIVLEQQDLLRKEIFNKLISENAENTLFEGKTEINIPFVDMELLDGLKLEDLNKNIVLVKLVEGKYQIRSVDSVVEAVIEKISGETADETADETVLGQAQESLTNAAEVVTETAKSVADSAIATYESLTAPAVEEPSLPIEEPLLPKKTFTEEDEEDRPISIELPVSEPNFGPTAAAAAGGYKKKTKRQLNNIKKFTKRKGKGNKNKNKNKKLTKRNRRKQIKKTKRRH